MGPTRSRPANVIDPLGLFGVGRLGHHIGLPSLEDASDTAAGFGDGAFGLTRKIRQALDVDNVNRCSAAYAGGNIVGTIAAGSWGLASRCSAMASTPGSPSRNGERGRAQVGSRSICTSEPKRPFYVVHGELALWLDGDALVRGFDGDALVRGPGSYVLVRAGWAHTFLGPA